MGLLDQIRADIAQITQGEFSTPVTFTSAGATPVVVTVNAVAVKHHVANDSMGNVVNGKNARVSVAESVLTGLGYPVRTSSGEAYLKGHRVTWADSSGQTWTYIIREQFPDETTGLILCILGDFN